MLAEKMVSQDEINAMLWKACDTFRGTIDPSEYKNYILVFLFVKYLSDVYKDKYEQYQKEFNGNEELIKRRLSRERFILDENSTFDYIHQNRNAANIGEIINEVLARIEEENKAKLDGVFRNIDFNSEGNLGETKDRNRRLKNLIEDFANPKLDLRPSRLGGEDIIGNAYGYMIERFAADAGKKAGEFYTPAQVSELLAKLLKAKEGDRISDPTTGSGSLLMKVAGEIGNDNYSLYGQEMNGSTWALCKMNMFLHCNDSARIEWGDTINNPKLIEDDHLMKFDIVVANPPFSLDKWGAENAPNDKFKRFHRGVPPKNRGDYAFITHMLETTNEFGKVGVIVPHGVLFREGAEGVIRKKFIDENLLDAVIGLPQNLFFGTGIPAAILIFKKGRTTKDVMFIDASREFEAGKNQNRLRPEDMQHILDVYNAGTTEDKYSYRATREDIIENDYNLNIPRYVDTFEEEEEIDIKATQQDIQELEKQLAEVQKEMAGYLQELGLNG